MMIHIDIDFYHDVFGGIPISETEFSRIASRASHGIYRLVSVNLNRIGLENLPDSVKQSLKFSVCAQAEFNWTHGATVANDMSTKQDFTIGSVTIRGGGNRDINNDRSIQGLFSPIALSYLTDTGLLYRGVKTT